MKTKVQKEAKPKRQKKVRTPRESVSLIVGVSALLAAGLSVMASYMLFPWLGVILGGCAVIAGLCSLVLNRYGALFAVMGMLAGFLNVLSAIVIMKMQ